MARLLLSPAAVLLSSLALASPTTAATVPDDGGAPAPDDTFSHLPDGAIARLGSTRLRHDAAVVGHVLLRGGSVIASISHDRSVRTWDVETGQPLARHDLPQDEGVPTAISRVDDERFLVSLLSGHLVWFDAELERVGEAVADGLVRVTSGPGGDRLVGVAEMEGDVELLASDGAPLRTIESDAPRAVAWTFSADGARLAIAGWKIATRHTGTARVKVVEVESGDTVASLDVGDQYVQSLAFSPDARTLAIGDGAGALQLLDLERSVLGEPQVGHETSILVTEWSADGRWITTGSARDGKVAVYDGESGGWIHTFAAHAQSIAGLAFTADASGLVSSSSDARLRVFETATGEPRIELPGHTGPVTAADWSPDGAWVATGGFDGTARLWRTATWGEERVLPCGPGAVNDVAFSPDGKLLATAGQDATLRVFSLETGEQLYGVVDGQFALFDLAWSPDGLRIATAHGDGSFRLHDAISGRVLGRRTVGHGFCFSVAFSPDGEKVAAASSRIGLWSTAQLDELRPMPGPNAPVNALAFDAEGRLWSGSADRRVIRWNVGEAVPELEFVAHPSRVQSLALSPGGDLIATCGFGENVIRLWSVEDGEDVDAFAGHGNIPSVVAFDPAGGRLVSAAMDSNGLVWKLR